LDLHRYRPERFAINQFITMLLMHEVNLIFDVGANIGQYAKEIREAGYRGRIISFEPLSAAHDQLLVASRNDSQWEIAPRAAIGNSDEEIDIHVAGNSASSSVLGMCAAHVDAAPESRYIGSERVQLRRLDSFASNYFEANSVPFLKIDTQGYEDRVLDGTTGLLDRFVGLQLELSLVRLYEGQCLYDEMIAKLQALGFELWAIAPVFFDPMSKRLLQIDATFFRR
ncbi:MAG: FkbM family methyltransferase, partial [Burkholderiaceae bacterium]